MARVIHERDNDSFHEAIPAADTRYVAYRQAEATPVLMERNYAVQIVYAVLSIVEVLLALRLLLRALGASVNNGFVQIVYILSYPLVRPFAGMFSLPINNPISNLEIATLVAIVIYALFAYVAIQIIRAIQGRPGL